MKQYARERDFKSFICEQNPKGTVRISSHYVAYVLQVSGGTALAFCWSCGRVMAQWSSMAKDTPDCSENNNT